MSRYFRRISTLSLVLLCMLCLLPFRASAGWADGALEYAMDTGMLSAGDLRPTEPATRAELASMVTQLMQLHESAPLTQFPDVSAGHPYYEALSRAVKLGLLQGSDGLLKPDAPVTREQAFVILARAFALPEADGTALVHFTDRAQISGWAAPAAASLVQLGLAQGSNGLLRPRDTVSRQELAQLLLNLTQRICNGDGGTAILPAGMSAPEGAIIEGSLYLCCEAGTELELDCLTVRDRLVVRGSGTLRLHDCKVGEVVLCDSGITLSGGAAKLSIRSDATLQSGTYNELTCTGGTVTVDTSATVKSALLCGQAVALTGSGKAEQVRLTCPDCAVQLPCGELIDAVDYGLRNLSVELEILSEPTPDVPVLRAKLHLADATPLPDGQPRDVQLQWLLGESIVQTRQLSLRDCLDAELELRLDYSRPLSGPLSVLLSSGGEDLRHCTDVNLPTELVPVTIETIRVQATVTEGCGLFSDMSLMNYTGWVNVGTVATYVNYFSGVSAKLELPDGRIGWVAADKIAISNDNYVRSEDYTAAQKEYYVNTTGYASQTDYLVWISLKCQRVNVFTGSAGQWKLAEAFPCSSGKNSTPTIAGVFAYQYRQDRWDFGQYYVQPVLVFNGGHAFHSRTYTPSGSLLDPTLGSPASAGCIRMQDEDVKWLDWYLPLRSTVVVY